jgi:hypothetical protein
LGAQEIAAEDAGFYALGEAQFHAAERSNLSPSDCRNASSKGRRVPRRLK